MTSSRQPVTPIRQTTRDDDQTSNTKTVSGDELDDDYEEWCVTEELEETIEMTFAMIGGTPRTTTPEGEPQKVHDPPDDDPEAPSTRVDAVEDNAEVTTSYANFVDQEFVKMLQHMGRSSIEVPASDYALIKQPTEPKNKYTSEQLKRMKALWGVWLKQHRHTVHLDHAGENPFIHWSQCYGSTFNPTSHG